MNKDNLFNFFVWFNFIAIPHRFDILKVTLNIELSLIYYYQYMYGCLSLLNIVD